MNRKPRTYLTVSEFHALERAARVREIVRLIRASAEASGRSYGRAVSAPDNTKEVIHA